MSNLKNQMTRTLFIRLLLVMLLCMGIFAFSAFLMNKKSSQTIGNVGDSYMHCMSEEITLYFENTIFLRLSQIDALITDMAPDHLADNTLESYLAERAKTRGFEYLALCTADGRLNKIYGNDCQPEAEDIFISDLLRGESKIALSTDSMGEKIVLMGIPNPRLSEINHDFHALVAGLSLDYINETLSLNNPNSPLYSHIIRQDGTFVLRGNQADEETYFDLFAQQIPHDADYYIKELQNALSVTHHYSAVIPVNGGHSHLHCTKLAYSDWFLIVVMPYSSLDSEISLLSRQWIYITFTGCIILLAALLWVFGTYFKALRQQMAELDKVRQEAVNANRAKSEFLSNMSHDIRTPMNAIVGMTTIAIANSKDPQQVQNCLHKIALSSKHLLGLINDVLDMSKIESGKLTLSVDQISLREVTDSIINIIQPQVKAKKQSFDVSIHDILAEDICCDSVRLNQIMINILGNSVKFTPEGGSVRLSIHQEESPKGCSFVRTHILVEDNGIGMTPEFLTVIFDSFTRADSKRVHRTEGSGLGMAITKYIVDAMGGTIDIWSQPDKGSRFHVTLDLEKAQIKETDMHLPPLKMLVVDDDIQLCESTIASLNSMGACADWALNGENALKMAAEMLEKQTGYQIILLDWKLPEMDGLSLARELRHICGRDIPILLTSAYDWNEIEETAQKAGITGFISKPLFRSTLYYGLKPYLAEELEDSGQARDAAADFKGKRILLAEDNDLNWEIARELLSDLGLILEWAENGQICLKMFQESSPGYYDAILMDIRMPVMNGHEATKAIRELDRPDAQTIPIIAMTADAFAEDIEQCLANGMNAHVAKPIDMRDVVKQLQRFLK